VGAFELMGWVLGIGCDGDGDGGDCEFGKEDEAWLLLFV
jgi:hypothetical protein